TDLPPPRHLGYPRSRHQRLRDDPCLLIRRPASPAARSRQDLPPPIAALRVIANVKHKDSSKPSASGKSTTSGEAIKQGHLSSAYGVLDRPNGEGGGQLRSPAPEA